MRRYYAAAATLLVALLLARVLRPDAAPPVLALPAPGSPAAAPSPTTPAAVPPASAPTSPPSPAASTSPAAPLRPPSHADLRAVLAALDATRSAAFAAPADGDPDLWAVTGCTCYADDVRRLRALARDGTALRGHRTLVDALTLAAPPTPERADLVVVDRTSAYTVVDASGRVVARWPASGPRRWRVTLVRASARHPARTGGPAADPASDRAGDPAVDPAADRRDRWLLGSVARAP